MKAIKEMPPRITDKLGRTFKKLRISVTTSCNFHCEYCVPDGETHPRTQSLPPEELAAIALKINSITPLESIRITGGEPLLYKGVTKLVRLLKEGGIHKVGITTNGSLLSAKIAGLKDAGLDSVNISLDSLDKAISNKLSRSSHFQDILQAVDDALAAGVPVKLNCTVMKGSNESQIIPLLEYSIKKNIPIRFIELMEMGHLKGGKSFQEKLFLTKDILQVIGSKYSYQLAPRTPGSTSDHWVLENLDAQPLLENPEAQPLLKNGYQFGIISNISRPFCSDCDRLRLSSEGKIYGCLSVNEGFDARFAGTPDNEDNTMDSLLIQALGQKQPVRFTGSNLSMRSIGG